MRLSRVRLEAEYSAIQYYHAEKDGVSAGCASC